MPEGKAAQPALPRKAPHGTFWDRAPGAFRCQIPLLNGKRYRAHLRMPSGDRVADIRDVHAAMVRMCIKLDADGVLDRESGIAKRYLPARGENVLTLQPREELDDDENEIPAAVVDEIASWRRIMHATPAQDARERLRLAAADLFKVLLVVKAENNEATHALAYQAVLDAMQGLADFHHLDPDDALWIMSEALAAATVPAPLPASTPARARAAPAWREHVVGAQDLCDERFADVKFIVPGLIPEGVALLVSRPKLGKSWMLLQIGSSIAGGVSPLVSADEPPACGDVLWLSLEDNNRRVQRRMTKHFGARRECWPERLQIATAWRRLDQGGLQDVREWCKSVKKPTLVMVDTLKKVRAPRARTQSDYDADYEACEGLIQLAHEFPGLAFIVAHHDRKMDADDVFDTVSGTLGLTGGVDTIAILKRSGQGVTLHIQGRDLVDDVEKAVRFDRETCRWQILGEAAEVRRSSERARVLAALRKGPAEGLSVGEIMADAEIGVRQNAWQLLHRMTADGEIERRGRGNYVLPGNPASGASGSQDGSEPVEKAMQNPAPDAPDTPDAA